MGFFPSSSFLPHPLLVRRTGKDRTASLTMPPATAPSRSARSQTLDDIVMGVSYQGG